MGLLTDPGAGRGKLTQILVSHHSKLCALSYISGVVWFMLLAHGMFNAGTYFSENALLPGLVKGEFDEYASAKTFFTEITEEAARYPDSVPYPWLIAKLKQLNLDTYTHNFTLKYPLGARKVYTGKNVYGILRAPRGSSTEALVLSVPYRPPNSVYPTTAPSLAIAMALAKFFRRQKYWAKDIIFLVTEHEQLGVQAWLEAYHGVSCGYEGVLDAGTLPGRGGSIQAAVNLEIHAERVGSIDVKVEGLNGQLPNLDLVNLVHRMCSKEGIRHTFKDREDAPNYETFKGWANSFHTLMLMVFTQSTGVPNGNHGLFHRFGIEAVTLEGFSRKIKGNPAGFYHLGRVVERIFRSLNNLLERFHQSFFFYLLPATDRYISIGMYMPPLGLIGGGLFIKAFVVWLKMQEDKDLSPKSKDTAAGKSGAKESDSHTESKSGEKQQKDTENDEGEESKDSEKLLKEDEAHSPHGKSSVVESGEGTMAPSMWNGVPWACVIFLISHKICLALYSSTDMITHLGLDYFSLPTETALFLGFLIASVILTLLSPAACNASKRADPQQRQGSRGTPEWAPFVNIAALLELSTMLLAVSMHNFSLALICAVIYVPPALWIAPTRNRLRKWCQRLIWIPLQPLFLMCIAATISTAVSFPEELKELDFSFLTKVVTASCNALTFSVVDTYAYGSWVFPIGCFLLLPNWILFWAVANA
ncbi:glycosylphosphatidylinositol anchor attachment 1 protein [Ischnura elegans]|uniref:glycosylphosphatidylinositol anchor attachment 1 protein n=1 Tax=Ischnura elegans TaxID=197161 RepID=UPI001ED8B6CE|nr:glycosylphosphatidylinositol anchor attachment 1 protein [Ischnura elegans]